MASFVSLAEKGFFNGTPCHRLVTAGIYVLQCGDPTGTGTGGPGYSFGPVENAPSDNVYPAGTIAMARQGGNGDSQGSQFFLVYKDSTIPSDPAGGYTVFGRITSGLDVVERVAEAGVSGGAGDGTPTTPISIEQVTVHVSDQTTPTPAVGEEPGDAVTEPTSTSGRTEVAEVAEALHEAAAQDSAESAEQAAQEGAEPAAVDSTEHAAATEPAATEPAATEPAATEPAAAEPEADAPAEAAPAAAAEQPAEGGEQPADGGEQPAEGGAPADAAATPAAPAAPKPGAGAGPGGRPRPAPKPRRAPRPHAPTTRPAVRPPSDPTPWGRMDDQGVVWLRTARGRAPGRHGRRRHGGGGARALRPRVRRARGPGGHRRAAAHVRRGRSR